MPSISSRISSPEDGKGKGEGERIFPRHPVPSPGNMQTSLSPDGNPAPTRGIFPIENMYDFQNYKLYPDGPNFVRGNVDISLPLRNLALQAYTVGGAKVN